MIIIAEGGSTKCDWMLIANDGQLLHQVQTIGLNPYFHDSDAVYDACQGQPMLQKFAAEVEQVEFFGAGCSEPALNQIIHNGLVRHFTQAQINVSHDLDAAAYSLYQGREMICCILGTGSNSCSFDGQQVQEIVPALGYVLGDEAGGSYFGKLLIRDYFYGRLPNELHSAFAARYRPEWSFIRNSVYNRPHANVFLANFVPFIIEHKDHTYIRDLVTEGLASFLRFHVPASACKADIEIGFVGSIAYFFQDILKTEVERIGGQMGKVIQRPAKHLLDYHVNHTDIFDQGTSTTVKVRSNKIAQRS